MLCCKYLSLVSRISIRIFCLFLICYPAYNCCAEFDENFESRIQQAISKVLPAVVMVGEAGNSISTSGSAFVLDKKNGRVITNYHVVARLKSINLKVTDEKVAPIEATLVNFDAGIDLALLVVSEKFRGKLPEELPLGDSTKLKLGEFVVAIGSPGGYDFSATFGIVSALNRSLPDQNAKARYIQVDAPLYHGSSGGPLCNLAGQVVGVNSRGGADGAAGFSIPVNVLKDFLEQGKKDNSVKQARSLGYLGALLQPLTEEFKKALKFEGQSGVLVSGIYPGSAAQKAGIKAGDILISLDSTQLTASADEEIPLAENYISAAGPGKHEVIFFRDDQQRKLSVVLESHDNCHAETREGRAFTLSFHANDGCFWFPQHPFVEINRYWRLGSVKPEAPREGDLLIALEFSEEDTVSRFDKLIAAPMTKPVIGTVIRGGAPRLVLVSKDLGKPPLETAG